jgi:c-di-GMP-binding flagellar brake protein YcgR
MSENQGGRPGTGPGGPAAPPRRPPPPPAAVQRRQHTRYDVKLSAEISLGEDVFTASTRDISEGGVGLDLDRGLPEGGELGINLFLVVDDVEDERTPTLKVRGFVAWCAERDEGEWAAGIRFAEVAANQKQWLKQFLEFVSKQ